MNWETFVRNRSEDYLRKKHSAYAEPLERVLQDSFGITAKLKSGIVLLERENGEPVFVISPYTSSADPYAWSMIVPDQDKKGVVISWKTNTPDHVAYFLATGEGYERKDVGGYAWLFEFAYPSCINDDYTINWDRVYDLLRTGTTGPCICAESESCSGDCGSADTE